jgi:hypothetical protein
VGRDFLVVIGLYSSLADCHTLRDVAIRYRNFALKTDPYKYAEADDVHRYVIEMIPPPTDIVSILADHDPFLLCPGL